MAVLWGQQRTFTLYTPDGKRNLTVRDGSPETIALEQLAAPFGLTLTEDKVADGLVITTRKGRIVAVPGQSFIQVAGRGVIGLDGPIRKERNAWIAPIDFLTKGLGPALGEPVVIRRSSRVILVGNVRVPQVGGRVERIPGGGARVVLSVQPATPHRVTRDGNKLTVRFDAAALDATPVTGFITEFAASARVDGTSIVIDLGPSAFSFKTEDDRDGLTIELAPPPPPPPPTPKPTPPTTPATATTPTPATSATPPAPTPTQAAAPQQIDLSPGVRTIVLDPGHGGEDEGSRGATAVEKDLTLALAKRLKSAIENRLGIRVLLTRDGDETLAVDRRAAFANNNKADLFLSLHANSSVRPAARGAQVYTLDVASYPGLANESEAKRRTVPLLGGGTRVIDPVPWELAQLPFAQRSSTFGVIVVQHFGERSVLLHSRPNLTAPLRVLAGANMPAVLIELGFLSNADDEASLGTAEGQNAIVEALLAAISDVRRGFATTERHKP